MSATDASMDDGNSIARDQAPLEVMLSRLILAIGLSVALGVVVMAVVWSSSPPAVTDAGTARHAGHWGASRQFHAAPRTTALPVTEANAAEKAGLGGRPSPDA
jgi:hypothetical protein